MSDSIKLGPKSDTCLLICQKTKEKNEGINLMPLIYLKRKSFGVSFILSSDEYFTVQKQIVCENVCEN